MVPAVAQVTAVVAGWIPGPGSFHMPWVQPKKKKEKKERKACFQIKVGLRRMTQVKEVDAMKELGV